MNSLIKIVLCVAIACGVTVAQGAAVKLAENGKPLATIVVAENASDVEKTAAAQLAMYLDKVTGGEFTIAQTSPASGNKIIVTADATCPDDGIVIETIDENTLRLAGHPQRGVLYAVNTFLEDVVGVRWWTAEETFVPSRPTLEVAETNVRYAPKLIYREAYYRQPTRDGIFAARMRCNGANNPVPAEWGGHHEFVYFVHSFFPLLPPEKYFAEHPEWYSEIDGKRKHEHAQLCLTNTEMRDELIKNAKESLRNHPNARFISISQNDWYGYCTCAKCKAVAEEEGAESGVLVRFVNAVAEEIEKEFPNVFVETLAYQYTRKPPLKTKPRDNVVIRLCTIECSFAQPLATGEQNVSLKNDMEGWSRIAKNIFVWDYVTNFTSYLIPHPNLRVLAPNIRFFVDNNTIGLFEQGDYYASAGDWVRLRNYVIAHLLWDQSRDFDKLVDEFLDGYYSPNVGRVLRRYLDLLQDTATKSDVYLGCFRPNTIDWLDFDALTQATLLLDEALLTAKRDEISDPVRFAGLVNKVRRERIPLEHVWLLNDASLRRHAQVTGSPFVGPPDLRVAAEAWVSLCNENGLEAHREFVSPADFQNYIRELLEKCATPPDN
ncbi:MAG: DUF4838 domain-containing protein [Thermoguttaceae bacterium]